MNIYINGEFYNKIDVESLDDVAMIIEYYLTTKEYLIDDSIYDGGINNNSLHLRTE